VKVEEVVCGLDHTLLRLADGTLLGCGNNTDGQLGVLMYECIKGDCVRHVHSSPNFRSVTSFLAFTGNGTDQDSAALTETKGIPPIKRLSCFADTTLALGEVQPATALHSLHATLPAVAALFILSSSTRPRTKPSGAGATMNIISLQVPARTTA
jgi:hypothetical protein